MKIVTQAVNAVVPLLAVAVLALTALPAYAGVFRGAAGGAIVGGLVGGSRGARAGAVVGGIAGAARAQDRRNADMQYQQQQADMERWRNAEERRRLDEERRRLEAQR